MRKFTPPGSRRLLTVLLLAVAVVATTTGISTTAQARTGGSSYIVLVPGDHGSRVVALQHYLHVRPASGYFGPRTRRAVLGWQATHHRHRTGKVGRLLWRHVRGAATSVRAPAPSRSSDRVASLNWRALARCESGGNPRAVNPAGYYGLYQFTRSTWRSVGGSGLPSRASAGEQTRRAQILYRRAGSGPWPVCGRKLFS
jgi:Transglycosylase-like domain